MQRTSVVSSHLRCFSFVHLQTGYTHYFLTITRCQLLQIILKLDVYLLFDFPQIWTIYLLKHTHVACLFTFISMFVNFFPQLVFSDVSLYICSTNTKVNFRYYSSSVTGRINILLFKGIGQIVGFKHLNTSAIAWISSKCLKGTRSTSNWCITTQKINEIISISHNTFLRQRMANGKVGYAQSKKCIVAGSN